MSRFDRRRVVLQNVQIRGSQAYASGQEARIPFQDLMEIGRTPGGTTYLAGILLAVDVEITKSSAGGATLEDSHAHDVFDQVELSIPWEERAIYRLTDGRAGSALAKLEHLVSGKRGHRTSSVSLTGSGTADTYRLKFFLPLGPHGREEYWYPLDLIRSGQLRIRWADLSEGATFGANVSCSSNTQIVKATAVLVEKNEFSVPPNYSVETFEAAGLSQSLPLAGRVGLFVAEIPVHSDGLTDDVVTNSERALVTVKADGELYANATRMEDLIELWNQGYAITPDERLTDGEADTAEFVPLYFPFEGRGYRLTYRPLFGQEPRLELTGSDSTPRLLLVSAGVNTPARVRKAAGIAGRPVSRMAFKGRDGREVDASSLAGVRLPIRV